MAEAVRRAVVFAPNWLGDSVMALPAIQSLRTRFPSATLAVAARPAVAALFRMVPAIDEIVTLDSRAGLGGLRQWRGDAARLGEANFDLALLLPNSFLSAWIASKAGIVERWGYATDLRSRWLTKAVPVPRAGRHQLHQADYYRALTSALGLPETPRVARLVPSPEAIEAARRLVPVERPFVVVAPGAAYGRAKQWPPEHVAALALDLWRTRQWPSLMVGAGGDRAAGDEVLAALTALPGGRGPAASIVDLIGRTDLPTLAGVLSLAHAVVANDSGAMHVAAAVGAPVVAVFGATDEHHTAPLPASTEAPAPRLAVHHVWCRPCMRRECPLGHQCMRGVEPAQVLALLP